MKSSRLLVSGGRIAGLVAAIGAIGWSAGATVTVAAEAGWTHWFANGSLDGFKIVSGTASYEVKDGVLVGTTAEGSPNTFWRPLSRWVTSN